MNANVSSSAEPTRIRWKIFGVLFLLVVVNMIDRASISIAMPTIAQELNLSGVMQGLVLSGFFWTYALMQIPSGLIADKFGPRSTVSISTVLWGASQALLGLCHNGIALIGARLLLGASEAPVFPAGARLNAIWLNKKERARGAVLMDAGGPFGAALGGILVAEMILFFASWRITFIIAGVATILLGFLAHYIIRDDPTHDPMVNEAELSIIREGQNDGPAVQAEGESGSLLHLMSLRSLAGMLVGRCAWAMMFFGLLTWGPSFLASALNLDLKSVGFATMIIFCAGGVGSLCGGFLCDRLVSGGMSRARSCKLLLTISGLLTLEERPPLGYIPCGSTNDFAASLRIPLQPLAAAQRILKSGARRLDVGRLNDRYFIYVASFGAFTKASYSADQTVKNDLGHLAYIIEGMKSMSTLRPYRVKITADGEVFEGGFLFGAVRSGGGVRGGGLVGFHRVVEGVERADHGLLGENAREDADRGGPVFLLDADRMEHRNDALADL